MRTARRSNLLWTLVAAALASLATVLALPGGGSAVTLERPDNTRRAADQRHGDRRLHAHRLPGHVDRRADELRVPVGALPQERREPGRERLRRDRRRVHHQLRGRRGRRRPAAPGARHRGERRRATHRRVERDRARPQGRHGSSRQRPAADAQRHARAGSDPPGRAPARGTASSRSRSRSSGSAATARGNNCVLQAGFATTPTRCARVTSARRSAPASSPGTRAASRVASRRRARPWRGRRARPARSRCRTARSRSR